VRATGEARVITGIERTNSGTGAGAGSLIPILCALVITLVAFAWLDHVNPGFLVSEDGIRDQLLARDCTDLGQCHLIGPRTSVSEFQQGAVWLDLLIAIRLLGGDTATVRTTVFALMALAVGTLCIVIWRWVRPSIALPASILLIAALSVSRDPIQLVNGSISAFPDVLTAAGLLCYALSGRYRFIVLSAFALGLAINVHIGALSLLPPLIVIAALAGARPWRALFAAGIVLVATSFVTSRAAVLANVLALVKHGNLLPLLAAALSIALVSARFGRRFRSLSSDARAWITGLILIAPFGVGVLWLMLGREHFFDFRYLHPILAPAAALAAAVVWLPFTLGARWFAALQWIPAAASLAVAATMAARAYSGPAVAGLIAAWPLTEASVIADQATRLGWSYEDLVFRLQATECNELLAAMSVSAPLPNPVPRDGRSQLQVIKVRRDAIPPLLDLKDVVPLEGNMVAVVRQIGSWMRPDRLVACRRSVSSQGAPTCSVASRPAPETRRPEQFLFATRSAPGIHSLDLPTPYVATYEVPLSPETGASRELVIVDQTSPECGWRFTRVDGVHSDDRLPASRVRLHSATGESGLLVIEKPFGTTACPGNEVDNRYPPCVFEMRKDDPLMAFLAG